LSNHKSLVATVGKNPVCLSLPSISFGVQNLFAPDLPIEVLMFWRTFFAYDPEILPTAQAVPG
jgi:hypothetical protein